MIVASAAAVRAYTADVVPRGVRVRGQRYGWWSAAVILAGVGQPVLWAAEQHTAHPALVVGGVLVVVVAGPLGLAPRWPVTGLAVSAAALLTYAALGYPASPADLATLALVARVVAFRPPAVGVAASALVTVGTAVAEAARSSGTQPASVVANAAIVPVAAAAGVIWRARRRQSDLARREHELEVTRLRLQAEQATAAERLRLARELHDAVGHSVTLAGLRAEAAARLVQQDPERARTLLSDIGRHTRGAMTELHQLVGMLRDAAEPPARPGHDLAGLLQRFAGPDLHVELVGAEVADGLPSGLQEVVGAVVGEGLANVVRHADARRATVRLACHDGELVVEVADDGRGPAPQSRPGFGLAGARERAEAVGGRLHFGPGSDGGGLLRVRLPVAVAGEAPLP